VPAIFTQLVPLCLNIYPKDAGPVITTSVRSSRARTVFLATFIHYDVPESYCNKSLLVTAVSVTSVRSSRANIDVLATFTQSVPLYCKICPVVELEILIVYKLLTQSVAPFIKI
jgi:hypothetical protein